jgi:UDP-glucuronate 4-epimerase
VHAGSRVLVTGAAGFIGSHLVELLLARGHRVIGVDCFTPYYGRDAKEANLRLARQSAAFTFVDADLLHAALDALLDGVDRVFHLAAQPGVRGSWAKGFEEYTRQNVLVTQRLLEAALTHHVRRFVYASSSSVYGDAIRFPSAETDLPRPFSPYGVTKLAAEHLCSLMARNHGLATVSLRYFTVFGSRQRPDMAIHRMIESALQAAPYPMLGDGAQVRDFTFVADVVEATAIAGEAEIGPGSVLNVAGGSSASMNQVVGLVEKLCECPVPRNPLPAQPGDVDRTAGAIDLARDVLDWKAETSLEDGLIQQVAWHLQRARGALEGRSEDLLVASSVPRDAGDHSGRQTPSKKGS